MKDIIEKTEIMYTTTDWHEYKEAYDAVSKYIIDDGYPEGAELLALCFNLDGSIKLVDWVEKPKTIKFPAGTVLTHYSKVPNLKELNSSFRSFDGCLYSSNRVYFFVDDTNNSDRCYENKYIYICDGTEEFYVDSEFKVTNDILDMVIAVYLSSPSPFSVPVNFHKS